MEKGIAEDRVPESKGRHGNRPERRGKRKAPKEPLPGENGKKGKGRAESQVVRSEKKTDERKLEGSRKARKGSTGGTAVGAKPGRMKGNKQKAKYQKPEKKHGKPGGREGGKRGSRKGEPKHQGSN